MRQNCESCVNKKGMSEENKVSRQNNGGYEYPEELATQVQKCVNIKRQIK